MNVGLCINDPVMKSLAVEFSILHEVTHLR